MKNPDLFFMDIAERVSLQSKCLSRKFGAVIVKGDQIVSTGWNGPPRGVYHCGVDRYQASFELNMKLNKISMRDISSCCPRKLMGFPSGQGLEWCTAAHAEANAIFNAARRGISTLGCTLYLNGVIPCKDCLIAIIQAGITEVVCLEDNFYHPHSKFLLNCSEITLRVAQGVE